MVLHRGSRAVRMVRPLGAGTVLVERARVPTELDPLLDTVATSRAFCCVWVVGGLVILLQTFGFHTSQPCCGWSGMALTLPRRRAVW